ncbi:hypothetical protein LOK49_LG09G00344 [Camellia lanceoleosa]|uniref:Uncharacterized protein n=1 Tax=Camellia lanceoleosa TaxID=1840588 RepID=A0ACC0GIM6_9ERIC|nr:hypothetical protein LOK49_LG09G00344 [Camellia lanceoleosa]
MSHNTTNEEMEKLEVQLSELTHSAVGSYLEPASEAIHQVSIVWWIDEIRLNLEPRWMSAAGQSLQATQMAALRSTALSQTLVRNMGGLSPSEPLPHLPTCPSMNIMLWNCRGASNKTFRRNFREITRTHRPEVVALFETKVLFSSMGLFFNNLGYIKAYNCRSCGTSGRNLAALESYTCLS